MIGSRSLVLLLLLALTPATFAGVDVEWDKSVDFSQFETYGWKKGTAAAKAEIQQRIVEAIEAQLEADGLTRAKDGEPDLLVATHAAAETSVNADAIGYAGTEWRGWLTWNPAVVDVREITTGTLMVDLLDGENETLVWRALASETVGNPNKKKVMKKINKVVAKMFRKYPPGR